ncbi:MAG TPA: prepilin-type N-terminal cleavage/methylation domain-containing protein [Candidatus Saccharimonadales bacterium]|nr:prepilin-type N-terminal cleavage/methylation domain-containing protein [Candidatus Saccharimonadales bacterium]
MRRQQGASQNRQRGFTIVELMMATLVFSMVLLLVTLGVLQVNRVYYKGVTEANTQSVARSIMDTISQAIQFDGGAVTPLPTMAAPTPGTQYYFCINNQQFIYRTGYQLVTGAPGANQTNQAFIQRTIPGSCTPPGGVITGRELLSPNMRLSNVQITQVGTTDLYRIEVRIIYGDDVSLNNPTSTTANCKGIRAGNQFCAFSDLTTVVEKRIN